MALINFVAVRHGVPLDLTENKLFTLSPQTQEIVENLRSPLRLWIFQREPNQSAPQLLENYSRYSANFQYQFIDPDVRPNIAI